MMLYALASRLKNEGRSAAEIRAELAKVGANKEEIDVLLGSLGFAAQTHTAAPDLLNRASRVTSSRRLLAIVFVLVIIGLAPVIYVIMSLIEAARLGR